MMVPKLQISFRAGAITQAATAALWTSSPHQRDCTTLMDSESISDGAGHEALTGGCGSGQQPSACLTGET